MTDPSPSDEDALAELLADRVIALVDESHPSARAKFRRRLARLYLRQLTGSEQPPGKICQRRLAANLGVSKTTIFNLEHQALAKLWLQHADHLLDEL